MFNQFENQLDDLDAALVMGPFADTSPQEETPIYLRDDVYGSAEPDGEESEL